MQIFERYWFYVLVVLAYGACFFFIMPQAVRGETCLAAPDFKQRQAGHSWRWRQVDGRKCWFFAKKQLAKEDLIWSYDSDAYDSDVKVIERKPFATEWILEERWPAGAK